jgi:hypothetical protein
MKRTTENRYFYIALAAMVIASALITKASILITGVSA